MLPLIIAGGLALYYINNRDKHNEKSIENKKGTDGNTEGTNQESKAGESEKPKTKTKVKIKKVKTLPEKDGVENEIT